ncbi:MAG: hypothetical protein HEQ39_07385 [Rhizobacter sp.]|jgi:hypothetical protein
MMNDNIYWQELGNAIRCSVGLWVVLAALIIAVGTLTHGVSSGADHCGSTKRQGTPCRLG